jgi:hypothetical protein
MLDIKSLANTIDWLNETWFDNQTLAQDLRLQSARWIASRQGLKGAYSGLFAPTEVDWQRPLVLFTGEKVTTGAGRAHILGEEALRALTRLGMDEPGISTALQSARQGIGQRLSVGEAEGIYGQYCCGTCTASYWRTLTSRALPDVEKRLSAGLKALKQERLGNGRWRRYPYYYTLLALIEMDPSLVLDELRYAAPGCERLVGRKPVGRDVHAARRIRLAQRVLAAV